LTNYGTHYVDSVSVGGNAQQITKFNNVTSENLISLTLALQGKFNSGGTSVQLDLSLGLSLANIQIQTQTTSTAIIMGGDPSFTDFLLKGDDPASSAEMYVSWKSTLYENPVAIRFRLVEIWQLWPVLRTNSGFGLYVCQAIGDFLQFLAENPSYCDGVPDVLSADATDGGLAKGDIGAAS